MPKKSVLTTEAKPINFVINDQTYNVYSGEVGADFSLANYIRERVGLTGTKIMCQQAGCGACIVTARVPNPVSGESVIKSVNSCVTPVLSCDGWNITTVEGLGNKRNGLHPIQSRLAAFHGTQCGYCSPGMVMQMNSLMEKNPDATMQEIEDVLDGNLCRCTGYRPIFDAFKSMASDASQELRDKIPDIEDAAKICPKSGKRCSGKCGNGHTGSVGRLKTADGDWFTPENLDDLLSVLNYLPQGAKYRLVAGNTGTGIYNEDGPYVSYIDVKRVATLNVVEKTASTLDIGGGVNLHDVIKTLESAAEVDSDYFYGKDIGAHLRKVANTGVRHMGTIAGNLMLKHAHNDFPSDVFTILEGVGAAIVTIAAKDHVVTKYHRPSDWLKASMDKQVLLKVVFPQLNSKTHVFKSFKITPRSQNAHAYVNAAFLAKLNKSDFLVLEKPSLVYGGIGPAFIHASKTESFLVGKNLNKLETLKAACDLLEEEVQPVFEPVASSVEYRKYLTQALLYKFILGVLGDQADPALQSGATQIPRNLSRGEQHYATDETLWPVNKPIPKIEGQSQCSGEAEFISDLAPAKGELCAAFVISDAANCDIDVVDPSEALAIPGVVAYIDHKDIPGKNNWSFFDTPEEIFSTGHIYHCGQTIGMIIADNLTIARKAAKAVKITYKNHKSLILSIREAMAKDKGRITSELNAVFGHKPEAAVIGDMEAVSKEADLKVIEGEVEIGSQYHFYMETLACIVRPIEDEQYEVFCTTQWMHLAQAFVASALNIQKNKVDVKVRRLGGGYGGKATPSQLMAAATAVAARKVNRPVRVVLDMRSNMEMFGKRLPYLGTYRVGVNPDGLLRFVDLKLYCNTGYNINQATVGEAITYAQNAYNAAAWNIVPHAVITDLAPNTYTRGPGTTQGHNIIECIMDHLANHLGMDPVELRLKNFLKDGDTLVTGKQFSGSNPLPAMIEKLKGTSNFEQRKADIEKFNQSNMWRKRGIALVPCKYNINYFPLPFYCHISVYEGDGTVSVATGGIEMGQGLNTKVAAIVAKELELPLEMIAVKPADSFVEPNNSVTGGSMSSELCVNAARLACQKLKDRMATVKSNMQSAKWHELVTACFYQGVDLCARHMGNSMIDQLQDYFLWGCVVTEVELDVLTGEKKVVRVDILSDTGASLSPEVDIGQIEGGFHFGLGLWMQEEIKHDPATGKILTYDTWEYKPPASMDIPEDLRVSLYEWDRDSGKGVLGSKATGEPSVHMGVSCVLALRRAIDAARTTILKKDPKDYYFLSGPATVEKTQLTSGIKAENFVL